MIRWYRLAGVLVRIPAHLDVVVVKGRRFIRRRTKYSTYWVDERGVAWKATLSTPVRRKHVKGH